MFASLLFLWTGPGMWSIFLGHWLLTTLQTQQNKLVLLPATYLWIFIFVCHNSNSRGLRSSNICVVHICIFQFIYACSVCWKSLLQRLLIDGCLWLGKEGEGVKTRVSSWTLNAITSKPWKLSPWARGLHAPDWGTILLQSMVISTVSWGKDLKPVSFVYV